MSVIRVDGVPVGQRRLMQVKLRGSLKTLVLDRVVNRAADGMPCVDNWPCRVDTGRRECFETGACFC